MSEILSQDEVDSLLAGLDSGDVEAEKEVVEQDIDGVIAYDFTSQDKVVRARMPTFDVINDKLSREIRTSISTLLRTNVDVTASSLDTLKFSEFVRSLPVPTSLHVFRMEPLRGHGLVVLDSQLVYNLIDSFFGGAGLGTARVEGREFTSIEEVMIKKVVVACLKNIESAWASIESVKTSLIRSEMNPQFAAIVMPSDLVIVTKFEVELEQAAGNLVVCLPYSMIEPLRGRLASGFQAETEEIDLTWRRRLQQIILDSAVELRIQLGVTEISGERLIYMQKGDVIQLDCDAKDMLTGYIGDIAKFKGYAGLRHGMQAFRIEEKIIIK